MKLSELSSSDLQRLIKLTAERESLVSQLAQVEAQINGFTGGAEAPRARRGRPPKAKSAAPAARESKGRRGPRKGEKPGKLKEAILAALQRAGNGGLSVGELSDQLKVKSNNIYSWFYTTGRKNNQIKKNSEGKYIYSA